MRYFELYSGIGGFRKAFDILSNDLGIECKCVGHSEVDPLARQLYNRYHEVSVDELEIASIVPYREVISSGGQPPMRITCKSEPLTYGCFDMLVADVPCEKYADPYVEDAGTMLGNVIWMARQFGPEFVLLETPWNTVTYDKGKSFQAIINSLQYLGYFCSFAQINANQFGLPQDRKKVYIFATLRHEPYKFSFSTSQIGVNFMLHEGKHTLRTYTDMLDILEKNVIDGAMWISDTSKQFIFDEKFTLNLNLKEALALKPGMSRLERSNADNYYTRDFIETGGEEDESVTINKEDWKHIKDIRRLTHNECALLQGFEELLIKDAYKCYVTDTALYRMLGQSTCVNMAYAALLYVVESFELK